MYDVEGTDTGREWIEVENTGSSSIDLSNYRLAEGGTNHTLTLSQGSPVLAPGSFAAIADDVTKFKADWPGFSGTLFDSSFSLSNTGETISIKDGSLATEDTATYASDMGAAGDGNSLVRSGATFVAQTPSPGSANTTSSGNPDPTPPSASSTDSTSQTETTQQKAAAISGESTRVTVHAGGDRSVTVGADSVFEATAFGVQGKPLRGPGVRFLWNFGDGGTREGERVMYAYTYPGTYVLMVSMSSEDYSATDRATVEALPAQVSIRSETDGGVSVFNTSGRELDVSLWIIGRGEKTFTLPRGTVIAASSGIRISPTLLQLPVGVAILLYPNGTLAVREGDVQTALPPATEGLVTRVPLPSTASKSPVPVTRGKAPSETSSVSGESTAQEVVGEQSLAAAVVSAEPVSEGPLWPWLLATCGVIGIGGVAAFLVRRKGNPADEYEIIDESDRSG